MESRGKKRFVWTPAFRAVHTGRVTPDPGLAEAVRAYRARLSRELDVEIGATETELDSRRAMVRTRETAIGNLVADAMRRAVGADVALTNGGGIRANRVYPPGTRLTRRDILSELPFGNKTVVLELTGGELRAALEHGFSGIEKISGRFPQVSGLKVVYDPRRPPGARVIEVHHEGAALDPDGRYTLATNDFMARGGDGYRVFAGKKLLIEARAGTLMASQVIDYIVARGTIAPRPEGRLRVLE